MATDLQVISRTEETSLIIGAYIFGPIVSGITICLLLCLIRYGITNPKNNNVTHYLLGIFSMLFTVLLNISFCILGTDLIVPWNDNQLLLDNYDNSTMLEFISLCIFLWYFAKALYYISFVYYTYSTVTISSPSKLYFKSFIYMQLTLTLLSVVTLIYLNHDIYQIAITPTHNIQVVTQLKGYFFNIKEGVKLSEIASMVPLFIDLSTLVALFKIYSEKTEQHVPYPRAIPTPRKHIALSLRAIMLLCFGSIPSWILYINIAMKSSIVWVLIPYDMLINNMCLFLLYSENQYLYDILCINCNKMLLENCIPTKVAPEDESQQHLDVVPSKSAQSESMNKHHKFGGAKELNIDDMDGLQLNTDDDELDVLHPPGQNKQLFGQYLSVMPSRNNMMHNKRHHISHNMSDIECKYENEGKLSRSRDRSKISPSPSSSTPSLSTSNIIKSIVMGTDKKARRCKSYNTDYLCKRNMDKEIEESLHLSIKCASKLSSETSVDPSHSFSAEQKESALKPVAAPFEVSPLCLTPSYNPNTPSISGMSMSKNKKNDDNLLMAKMDSCCTRSASASSSAISSSSCCSVSGSGSSADHSSCCSGCCSSDADDELNSKKNKKRYLHNRSTIDLATVIQKELSVYDDDIDDDDDDDDDDETNENTVSNSISMANAGVPSFGHHVHFSFFE